MLQEDAQGCPSLRMPVQGPEGLRPQQLGWRRIRAGPPAAVQGRQCLPGPSAADLRRGQGHQRAGLVRLQQIQGLEHGSGRLRPGVLQHDKGQEVQRGGFSTEHVKLQAAYSAAR